MNLMIKRILPALIIITLCSVEAFAMAKPGTGTKFKFLSDLVVNDIVQGPVGYTCAVLAGLFTAGMVIMSKLWPALGGIIGTVLIVGVPELVESAGAVIF